MKAQILVVLLDFFTTTNTLWASQFELLLHLMNLSGVMMILHRGSISYVSPSSNFQIFRFESMIKVGYTGKYKFKLISDGKSTFEFNYKKLIDKTYTGYSIT